MSYKGKENSRSELENKDFVFLSLCFNPYETEYYLKKTKGLQGSVNNFQLSLVDGFLENKCRFFSINCPPFGFYPIYKKIIFKTKKWDYKGSLFVDLNFINIPLLKQKNRFFELLKYFKKKMPKNDEKRSLNIVVYSLYVPYLKALYKLKKRFNLTVTLIVTDLPNKFGANIVNPFKRFFWNLNGKKQFKFSSVADRYVFLTKHMNDILNPNHKPFTIVEGINSIRKVDFMKDKKNEKTILYTGSLDREFGCYRLAKMLHESNENIEFWICGSGEDSELISLISKKDKRIKFFGFLPREEILLMQTRVSFLINPRTPDKKYTKYSFPSKIIEYLSSGTPVICYKLSGIPDEYDAFLNYLNRDENMVSNLNNLLSAEYEYYLKKAIAGKIFVDENKNSKIQAKKIIDLMEE